MSAAAPPVIRNWARNQAFTPSVVLRPRSVDELRAAVLLARGPLRVLGSLHSFSRAADPGVGGTALVLDGLAAAPALDARAGRVRVRASTSYGELAKALAGSGWALPNMASLPHISVAGAVATATHGSGLALGNLATAVCGLEVVTGRGALLSLRRDDGAAAWAAWPVHLGVLGAVYEVELALVRGFELAQTVYENLPWEPTLAALRDVMGPGAGYSVSLFTRWADGGDGGGPVFDQCWRKRLSGDGDAPEAWRGGARARAELHPLPGVSAAPCTPQLGAAGPAHDRLPHFRLEFTPSSGEELQTEYFVRFSDGADALRAVARLRARIAPLLHITEVRAVAADALWMSMCFERESLALHFTWKAMPAEVAALLPDIEAALAPFAPRPHWGKLFAMRDVGRLYPRLDDFRALCAEHDPSGKFASQWLREVGVVA